ETGGVGGTAREVNLFYTEMDGDDNARIIIPNGKLWGEIGRVPTRNDTACLPPRFPRPAQQDVDPAVAPLQELIRRRNGVVRLPRPANEDVDPAIARLKELIERDKRVVRLADIGVDSVADDKYVLAARVWVKQADQTALRLELNRVVKEEFDRPAAKPGPAAV